jgi:hypothetical protein
MIENKGALPVDEFVDDAKVPCVVRKARDYGPSRRVVAVALHSIAAAAMTGCAPASGSSTETVDNCVGKQRADGARSHGDWLGNRLHKHRA